MSWLKKEGEQVKKGEMLLEVETDKAVVEIEAQGDGVLAGVTAKVGDVVPVGQTIAWLVKPGESVPTGAAAPSQSGRKMDTAPGDSGCGSTAAELPRRRRRSHPRRVSSRAKGVDISTVKGSGPGGEILADDIMKTAGGASTPAAAPAGPPKGGPHESRPSPAASGPADAISSIGRIMAERTTQSWTTVPHFFVTRELDATALNAARERLIPVIEKSHGVKVTHTDLMVAAVARALRLHPRTNGSWTSDKITLHPDVTLPSPWRWRTRSHG